MNKLERLKKVEKEGFKTAIYIGLNKDESPTTEAIEEILRHSKEGRVNIRTYKDNQDLGCPFEYGINSVQQIQEQITLLQKEGYNIIINETIDRDDGGISGVALGGIMEFAPFHTVRSAMKSGEGCMLPSYVAVRMMERVYNLKEQEMEDLQRICRLAHHLKCKVEFSVHPTEDKVLVWDIEQLEERPKTPNIDLTRTNGFSRFLGEKAYNLMLVNTLGLEIPKTKAISKYLKDSFRLDGVKEELEGEVWTRTSPIIKMAGKHLTKRGVVGWEELFNEEVSTVMYQEDQKVDWSGSAIWRDGKHLVIEGVEGYGDDFQVGKEPPKALPEYVSFKIKSYIESIRDLLTLHLGNEDKAFTIEWGIIDGKPVLFQINFIGEDNGRGTVIVPNKQAGNIKYQEYLTKRGLNQFRDFLETLPKNRGVKLVGNIGITSHFCDILRQERIPSFINRGSNRFDFMLVRVDNVPTDLSSEYKIMEGDKNYLEKAATLLNRNINSMYYSVVSIKKKLYNGYLECYGHTEVDLKEKFAKNKEYIEINGTMYPHTLNIYEKRILKEDTITD